jgi:hypothetical protein
MTGKPSSKRGERFADPLVVMANRMYFTGRSQVDLARF